MIGTIATVVRSEGWASAMRRTSERVDDAVREAWLRTRGAIASPPSVPVLNYVPAGGATRLGGVQTQLAWRLRCERAWRPVVVLRDGRIEWSGGARRVSGIDHALALTGARTLHVEGTHGADVAALIALAEAGIDLVVSVHDFTLLDAPLAQPLLDAAHGVVFPSQFLLDAYRDRHALHAATVIEPGIPESSLRTQGRAIAYAGAVKPHKGAALLPRLADAAPIHVFGGGDEALFRTLRTHPALTLHGYYRAGALPGLIARHGVGLVVAPSIVPETFCLVTSEAWQTGAAVAVLDHGAQAERVRRHGGGWIARDVDELAAIVRDWEAGALSAAVAARVPTAIEAALAYLALYDEIAAVNDAGRPNLRE